MENLHKVENANAVMKLEEAAYDFVMADESETEYETMSEVIMSKLRKIHEPS